MWFDHVESAKFLWMAKLGVNKSSSQKQKIKSDDHPFFIFHPQIFLEQIIKIPQIILL
jgi:hypothetical protein